MSPSTLENSQCTFDMRGALAFAACLCALATSPRAWADAWPAVAVPNGVNTFEIGQRVTVNGLPMQLRGFVSLIGARDVTNAFRQSLGKPLVENILGDKLVLGRVQGQYYVSVQIEAVGAGSRGVVAISDLKSSYDNRVETRANAERWLVQLPAGSRILSQMESQDGGKLSRHWVISNSQAETLNRDRLVAMLGDQGFAVEREGMPDAKAAARVPESLRGSRMLFFKGNHEDAIATIRRDAAGQTTVVLNIVTSPEQTR